MAKYGMYPQPVYHATLDDGRTVRMTVWQKENAPAKGFDWEACRRTILGTTERGDEPRILAWARQRRRIIVAGAKARRERPHDWRDPKKRAIKRAQFADFFAARAAWAWNAPTLAQSGRRIIAAHLEQSGVVLADDPLSATMHPAAKCKKAASTINNDPVLKELRASLKAALKEIDAGTAVQSFLALRRLKSAMVPFHAGGDD